MRFASLDQGNLRYTRLLQNSMQVLSLQTLTYLLGVGKYCSFKVFIFQFNPQKRFADSLNFALADPRACWPTGNAYHFTLSITAHC